MKTCMVNTWPERGIDEGQSDGGRTRARIKTNTDHNWLAEAPVRDRPAGSAHNEKGNG